MRLAIPDSASSPSVPGLLEHISKCVSFVKDERWLKPWGSILFPLRDKEVSSVNLPSAFMPSSLSPKLLKSAWISAYSGSGAAGWETVRKTSRALKRAILCASRVSRGVWGMPEPWIPHPSLHNMFRSSWVQSSQGEFVGSQRLRLRRRS